MAKSRSGVRGLSAIKTARQRWAASANGRASIKRCRQSEKGRATKRRYAKKWYAVPENRARQLARQAKATLFTKAIAESLVALFPELPDNRWREQFAREILESNSGQTLCWVNTQLEDYIVEYTEEAA